MQWSLNITCCIEFALKHKSLSVNIKAILPCTALYLNPQWSCTLHIAQKSPIIAQYMLYRIRFESEEFIRQYESDPAMYSTLPAPAVVIAHCILHRIRQSLNITCCTEIALKHKILTVNIKAILPCTALSLHP